MRILKIFILHLFLGLSLIKLNNGSSEQSGRQNSRQISRLSNIYSRRSSGSSRQLVKGKRNGKFIFNWVRFSNSACNTTHAESYNSSETGICYTQEECDSRGGIQTISCAAGFGTCCLFRDSCYGSITEKSSYFSNPGWPEANTSQSFCTFSLVVEDPQICQIRLDFETFELPPPSLTHSPIGECDGDRLAIFTSQQNLGLYQGNTLCGNFTGQHIYVPVDATLSHDPVRIFAFVGTNGTPYRWNIKSTMIDCSKENELRAPDGCLQYFNEPSGFIESFNYGSGAGSPYLAGTNYYVCVKRQTGICSLKLESEIGEFVMNSHYADNMVTPGNGSVGCVSSATNSNNDYISALGASSMNGAAARMTDAFYCGGVTNSSINPITVEGGTFEFLVHTDEGVRKQTGDLQEPAINSSDTSDQEVVINNRERGFRLKFTVEPCGFTFSP